MVSLLQDAAVIDHDDPIGPSYRRETVGDDEADPSLEHSLDPRLDELFRFGVHG